MENLRAQVSSIAGEISLRADRLDLDSINVRNPEHSVRLSSWALNLRDYAERLSSWVDVSDEVTLRNELERVKRSGHDVFRVRTVVNELALKVNETPETFSKRIQELTAFLADLPGDPIIGLPPPIQTEEEPAGAAVAPTATV
jgi:hypothetical protein